MRADGSLNWRPPAGRWRILRFGYSLTGATNHPAPIEATGLEVDKLDGKAVAGYLDHYLDMYREVMGGEAFGSRGITALVNDSIESGDANWTGDMVAQFKRLRGYDPVPWMPALAGIVIGSRRASDAFLHDFRTTIADLIADQHYGTIARIAHANGLRTYMESLEGSRAQLGDDMSMRAGADVPMAAMWAFTPDRGPKQGYIADIKGAASVANFYGQNIVAAESLTSLVRPWADGPRDLKRTIDLELVSGVNLPVIHTSVHQPVDSKPGLPFHIIGQYFNRLDSWAEMAKPWVDYIARSSFLLQQGRSVADVAYFIGEEAPVAGQFADGPPPDAPSGYGYDYLNAAMLKKLTAEGGELVSPGGAKYRALYLGATSSRMTLATLQAVARLAEAGAIVVGDRPLASPSLADDQAGFQKLANRLWPVGRPAAASSRPGVAWGNIHAALAAHDIKPDFRYSGASATADIRFNHRRLSDGDIYFVSNGGASQERIAASFRVTGKAPELWRADGANAVPLNYRMEAGDTVVPLELSPGDAFFVVFRKQTNEPSREANAQAQTRLETLTGPWQVTFQPGRGAPAQTQLKQLASFSQNAEPGIRYFSGISTYRHTFELPANVKPGERLMLDLGEVGDLAEVRINGKLAGSVWHPPYRVDIGDLVRSGTNELEIKVGNLWVNRLIGDAQPDAIKITSTARPVYKPGAPLRPAGLIGPVELIVLR